MFCGSPQKTTWLVAKKEVTKLMEGWFQIFVISAGHNMSVDNHEKEHATYKFRKIFTLKIFHFRPFEPLTHAFLELIYPELIYCNSLVLWSTGMNDKKRKLMFK